MSDHRERLGEEDAGRLLVLRELARLSTREERCEGAAGAAHPIALRGDRRVYSFPLACSSPPINLLSGLVHALGIPGY